MKDKKKLTTVERAEMEAEVAALRLKAKKLNAFLKEDEKAETSESENVQMEMETHEEVETTKISEESSTFEWVPTDEESSNEESTKEEPVEEDPAEEKPTEEEPVEEEPAEVKPTEEEPVEEEPAEEEPAEEESAEEESAEEEPAEEESAEEESAEEEPVEEEPSDKKSSGKKTSGRYDKNEFMRWVPIGALIIAAVFMLLLLVAGLNDIIHNTDKIPDDTTVDITDTTVPEEPVQEPEEIDLTKFITSVVNIIEGRGNEGSAIWNNVSKVCTDNEEELERLIEKYGEKDVKNKIADSLHGVPIIMMNQKIKVDKLEYHLDPEGAFDATYEDLNNKFNEADLKAKAEFANTTGLDTEPQGLIMTLPGYAQNSSNRAAIREMIKTTYSGKTQTALIDYYNEYTTSWDMCIAGIKKAEELKAKRIADTQAAQNFKREVEIKLITSENFIKLLEEQLKEIDSAYDYISMGYSQEYVGFVLKNFDAVIG